MTSCHGEIAGSVAYHSVKEQLRDHRTTEDAAMINVPRAFIVTKTVRRSYGPRDCLRIRPQTRRGVSMRRNEDHALAIGEAKATLERIDVILNALGFKRLQDNGEQAVGTATEQPLVVRNVDPTYRRVFCVGRLAEKRFGLKLEASHEAPTVCDLPGGRRGRDQRRRPGYMAWKQYEASQLPRVLSASMAGSRRPRSTSRRKFRGA